MFRQKVTVLAFAFALASVSEAAEPPHELLLRLQQLVQQGDLDTAQTQLQKAIQQFPSAPGLYNLKGTVEAQRGRPRDAEADFHKALAVAPDFTGALLNLGRLYLEEAATDPKAHDRALNAFEKVLVYDKQNSEALYQSAALLDANGAYQASLNHLDKLDAEAQARAQVLAVRCADQSGLLDRDRAADAAEKLLTSADLTGGDVLAILPLVEKSNVPLATWMLEQLAQRQPAGRETLLQLGQLYVKAEDLPRARQTMERAEQSGPPSAEILQQLARVAYAQHDREGTLGYLAQARDLDPKNAAVHFFFGVVCIELDLPLDARKSLDEAVRLDPQNPYYNYALGSVALHGRDPAQAIPYFEKYILLKPKDPRGRFALGVARFYMADYDAASKDLRAVAELQQNPAGAHYFLGRIARLREQLPEAEKEWQQAIAADPQLVDALADLGLLHIKTGQYDAAAEELKRAFTLEPNSFRVNANLLILYQKTGDPRSTEQQVRFEEIKKKRTEDEQLLWRTIEVRP